MMAAHDIQHNKDIIKAQNDKNNIFFQEEAKFLFYAIHNSLPLEKLIKELYILVLWYAVHEIPFAMESILSDITLSKMVSIILQQAALPTAKEFSKYISLTLEDTFIRDFLAHPKDIKQYQSTVLHIQQNKMDYKDYAILGIFYVVNDFRSILESLNTI